MAKVYVEDEVTRGITGAAEKLTKQKTGVIGAALFLKTLATDIAETATAGWDAYQNMRFIDQHYGSRGTGDAYFGSGNKAQDSYGYYGYTPPQGKFYAPS